MEVINDIEAIKLINVLADDIGDIIRQEAKDSLPDDKLLTVYEIKKLVEEAALCAASSIFHELY